MSAIAPPTFGPPQPPPPPGMGADPSMTSAPPPGMGGDPMMGAPQQPPVPVIPENPFQNVVDMLQQAELMQGHDAAELLWNLMPPSLHDSVRDAFASDQQVLFFLDSLEPKPKEPIYPAWFRPPPKPSPELVTELATQDEMEWRLTRQRIKEDLDLLYWERSEVPEGFDPKKDKRYVSSAMSDEARAVAAMLGTIEPDYEVPYVKPEKEEWTQQVENALYYWDQCANQASLASNAGDFRMAAASYLLYTGYVALRISWDPTNKTNPFMERFINPATIAPVWDGRGLLRVTRRYIDSIANIISDFEDAKGSVERRLLSRHTTRKGEDVIRSMTDRVMVTIYHDRYWTGVIADDIDIVPVQQHGYGGFVPYIVRGSGVGEPSGITELTDYHTPGTKGVVNARERWEKKNGSWMMFRKIPHAQFEEIMTIVRTVFERAADPSLILKQSPFSESQGDPEIHTGPGEITKISDQEELGPLIENPSALSAFSPLTNAVNQDGATNKLTPAFFGLPGMSQQSGASMENEYESGMDKISPFLVALRSFYGERASIRLRMYRDLGHQITDDEGNYGRTILPYRKEVARGRSDRRVYFELTPSSIEETGTDVEAILTHVRMQNLAALGNAASVWMQIGGMSAYGAMKLRGERDPDAVFEQRRQEKAMLDENVEKALTYEEIAKSKPIAAEFYKQLVLGIGPESQGQPEGDLTGMQTSMSPNTSAMNLNALGLGNGGQGRPQGPPMGGSQILGPNGQPITGPPFGP